MTRISEDTTNICSLPDTRGKTSNIKGLKVFTSVEGATYKDKSAKCCRVAFTLAEVLITLGIIGVVAAMTLPALISRYEKQETISKLKKVYSVLTSTTQMAMADYGDPTGWDLRDGDSLATSKHFADKYIIPYVKVARVCEDNSSDDCAYPIYGLNGQRFNNSSNYGNNSYCFYLTDGTYVAVKRNTTHANHSKFILIFFDINGQRKPNKLGKDVFSLQYILQTNKASSKDSVGKILPAWLDAGSRTQIMGTGNDEYCNKNKNGKACLAVIIMDGWEIKDDYPW